MVIKLSGVRFYLESCGLRALGDFDHKSHILNQTRLLTMRFNYNSLRSITKSLNSQDFGQFKHVSFIWWSVCLERRIGKDYTKATSTNSYALIVMISSPLNMDNFLNLDGCTLTLR